MQTKATPCPQWLSHSVVDRATRTQHKSWRLRRVPDITWAQMAPWQAHYRPKPRQLDERTAPQTKVHGL